MNNLHGVSRGRIEDWYKLLRTVGNLTSRPLLCLGSMASCKVWISAVSFQEMNTTIHYSKTEDLILFIPFLELQNTQKGPRQVYKMDTINYVIEIYIYILHIRRQTTPLLWIRITLEITSVWKVRDQWYHLHECRFHYLIV